jgi:hypothetical protein
MGSFSAPGRVLVYWDGRLGPTWDYDPEDEDLPLLKAKRYHHFDVYRSKKADGFGDFIGRTRAEAFLDTKVLPLRRYHYSVVGFRAAETEVGEAVGGTIRADTPQSRVIRASRGVVAPSKPQDVSVKKTGAGNRVAIKPGSAAKAPVLAYLVYADNGTQPDSVVWVDSWDVLSSATHDYWTDRTSDGNKLYILRTIDEELNISSPTDLVTPEPETETTFSLSLRPTWTHSGKPTYAVGHARVYPLVGGVEGELACEYDFSYTWDAYHAHPAIPGDNGSYRLYIDWPGLAGTWWDTPWTSVQDFTVTGLSGWVTYDWPRGKFTMNPEKDWTTDAYGWAVALGSIEQLRALTALTLKKGASVVFSDADPVRWLRWNQANDLCGTYNPNGYTPVPGFPEVGPGDYTVEITWASWHYGTHVTFDHTEGTTTHAASVGVQQGLQTTALTYDYPDTEFACDHENSIYSGGDFVYGPFIGSGSTAPRVSHAVTFEHCPLHPHVTFDFTADSLATTGIYGAQINASIFLGANVDRDSETITPGSHSYHLTSDNRWGYGSTVTFLNLCDYVFSWHGVYGNEGETCTISGVVCTRS